MCGIAGRVGPPASPSVKRMVASLLHRGPDSEGVRCFALCSLGMRRLRVIDLRPEADQPMSGEDPNISLVYNGELYNYSELRRELQQYGHRFRSLSDTEVLAHGYEQWGIEVVGRIRGMFAFAIWDERIQQLFLARDRLGIKPMYIRQEAGGGLSFASEVRAFGGGPIDGRAVVSYLRLGWTGSTATIRKKVQELPPGHTLTHHAGEISIRPYWKPLWRDEPLERDRLVNAVEDSVRRQLVADVPLGIFLSSGLDSAVVAAQASKFGHSVRTYTVAFDNERGESRDAAGLAAQLGLEHHVVRAHGDDIGRLIPVVIRDMDQPTVDGVNSWVISRAVREAGLTVALSGLGGDELFQGYSTFRRAPQIEWLSENVPRGILSATDHLMHRSRRYSLSRAARACEGGLIGGLPAAYASVRGLFSWHNIHKLWPGGMDLLHVLRDVDLLASGEPRSVSALELRNYLPCQLLRDTDTMSMAHSLEVRVPLLDDEVVEASLALRPTCEGLVGKRLLAEAGGPPVAQAASRPKLTFTLPFERWLHNELKPWTTSALRTLGASPLGFDPRALEDVRNGFYAGRVGWRPLWSLAVLGGWLERFEGGA